MIFPVEGNRLKFIHVGAIRARILHECGGLQISNFLWSDLVVMFKRSRGYPISSIYMHTRVRTLTRSISHSAKRISERKPYVPYGRRKQEEPDESEVIFGVVCIRERLRDRSP